MTSNQPFDLLFVCTGDVSRSPLAAARAQASLGANDSWRIGSAGIAATEMLGASDQTLRVAKKFKQDLSAHQSRRLTDDDIRSADLVLTMGWDEVSHVWSQVPEAWGTCFTLKEFIHYARHTAGRPAILFETERDRMRDRIVAAQMLRRRARSDHGFWGGLRPEDLSLNRPDKQSDAAWDRFGAAMDLIVADCVSLVSGRTVPTKKSKPRKKSAAGRSKSRSSS